MGAAISVPVEESISLQTLGDSALAGLVTDVSAVDAHASKSGGRCAENGMCITQ